MLTFEDQAGEAAPSELVLLMPAVICSQPGIGGRFSAGDQGEGDAPKPLCFAALAGQPCLTEGGSSR